MNQGNSPVGNPATYNPQTNPSLVGLAGPERNQRPKAMRALDDKLMMLRPRLRMGEGLDEI